jgi:hypothetical protein
VASCEFPCRFTKGINLALARPSPLPFGLLLSTCHSSIMPPCEPSIVWPYHATSMPTIMEVKQHPTSLTVHPTDQAIEIAATLLWPRSGQWMASVAHGWLACPCNTSVATLPLVGVCHQFNLDTEWCRTTPSTMKPSLLAWPDSTSQRLASSQGYWNDQWFPRREIHILQHKLIILERPSYHIIFIQLISQSYIMEVQVYKVLQHLVTHLSRSLF